MKSSWKLMIFCSCFQEKVELDFECGPCWLCFSLNAVLTWAIFFFFQFFWKYNIVTCIIDIHRISWHYLNENQKKTKWVECKVQFHWQFLIPFSGFWVVTVIFFCRNLILYQKRKWKWSKQIFWWRAKKKSGTYTHFFI